MREIKEYVRNKKNNNVIRLDIGGELKHYLILSFKFNIIYNRNPYTSELTIKTNSSDLIYLLSEINFTCKYDIYIDNKEFYGCFVSSYTEQQNNVKEFTISVDSFKIN
jgi:hypothetical protein